VIGDRSFTFFDDYLPVVMWAGVAFAVFWLLVLLLFPIVARRRRVKAYGPGGGRK